jgi:AcrR family transcriptional regulator
LVQQAERSALTTKAILKAARTLFARHGYADVSIDQIAEKAGYAKGAVYHHFSSKREIFEQVLDCVQADLQVLVAERAEPATDDALPRALARSILDYLQGAIDYSVRRVLLVDGPAVLGWKRWREIDEKYFADVVRAGVVSLMHKQASDAEITSATRLMLGAITEAALSSALAEDPSKAAHEHCATFELLLSGLQAKRRAAKR